MKRREFLIKLGMAAGLLGAQAFISGCIGTGSEGGETQAATATADAGPSATATATANPDAGSLAGTCPRGKSCTRPGCELWSDLNNDNRCDRGVNRG